MNSCLLCYSQKMKLVYLPLGFRRNAKVYLCDECGLLQTITTKKGDGIARASHLADFGNLRTGKGFRSSYAINVLKRHINNPDRVLDVGANRGAFTKEAKEVWGQVHSVEPDTRLWQKGWDMVSIEKMDLAPAFYDVIHLSHTLEHLDNPLAVLKQLRAALSRMGVMYVEVPNTPAILKRTDIFEEYFIDKHVTHWTINTLYKALNESGLSIVEWGEDQENIWCVCGLYRTMCVPPQPETINVARYADRLKDNLNLIKEKAPHISFSGITYAWGAGRLFDSFLSNGLDSLEFEGVIDSYSPLEWVYDIPVYQPDILEFETDVNLIVIFARDKGLWETAWEMTEAKEVLYWNDFLL